MVVAESVHGSRLYVEGGSELEKCLGLDRRVVVADGSLRGWLRTTPVFLSWHIHGTSMHGKPMAYGISWKVPAIPLCFSLLHPLQLLPYDTPWIHSLTHSLTHSLIAECDHTIQTRFLLPKFAPHEPVASPASPTDLLGHSYGGYTISIENICPCHHREPFTNRRACLPRPLTKLEVHNQRNSHHNMNLLEIG